MNHTLRETTPTWVLTQNHDHSIKNRLETIKNEYSDSHFSSHDSKPTNPCQHNSENFFSRELWTISLHLQIWGPIQAHPNYNTDYQSTTQQNKQQTQNKIRRNINFFFPRRHTPINNIKGSKNILHDPSAIFKIRAPLRPMQNHETRRILTSQ